MQESHSGTVLIVDDEEHIRELLTGWIETLESCSVLQAKNGEEGLEMARRHGPDVIVLDAVMPAMSGYEVCRELKADPDLCDIPVIFLTVQCEIQDVVNGLDAGAHAYITKPFKPQELLARIRSLLRLKSRHDALKENLARFESVLDEVPVGVALLDSSGRIERWNQTLAQNTGWSPKEAQGRPAADLLEPVAVNGAPDFASVGEEGASYYLKGRQGKLQARVRCLRKDSGSSLLFDFS
jgi:DNA-binding response OmpR family regulator